MRIPPQTNVATSVRRGERPPHVLNHVAQVGDVLTSFAAKSVFLVIDRSAFELSGARSQLATHWQARNVVEFDAFQCNPRYEDVAIGVDQFRRTPCDVIVAVGGGTALDVAKLVRCCADDRHVLADIIAGEQPIEGSVCPLIAVPTTAGTGSEATHFAVVYRDGVKHSLAHESIIPDVSIVDWRLTASVPPRIAAETGLDALCQAVESMWSIHSTSESMSYSMEALGLVVGNLETVVHAPSAAARKNMTRAAHLAGKAINITKTTAPHAISYKITHDFGIAHGHAVALTLGATLAFNAEATDEDVMDKRGVRHVRRMIDFVLEKLGCNDVPSCRKRIDDLMKSIGCETRLSQIGITGRQSLENIAASVNVDRLANNPRRMTAPQLLRLLETVQ